MRTQKVLVAVAAAAVGLLAGGCKPKEQVEAEAKVTRADLDQLQGRWKIASRSGDDDPDADESGPGLHYVIEGDVLRLVLKDEVLHRQKLGIIAGKEPKQVDLTYVTADGKPETVSNTTRTRAGKTKKKTTTLKDVAIYKVEGDRLTFCISHDEKKRPPEFTAPPGSSRYLLALERIKDGAKPDADADTPPTKTDAPKTDAPKTDPPKVDPPKVEAPKADAPKPADGKPTAGKADTPKPDGTKIVPATKK